MTGALIVADNVAWQTCLVEFEKWTATLLEPVTRGATGLQVHDACLVAINFSSSPTNGLRQQAIRSRI